MKRSKQTLPPPIFCPACQSAVEIDENQCWYCEYDLHDHRVCPYCRQAVPADEDPCHNCGRLEPAIIPEQERLDQIHKKFWWATFEFIVELLGCL